MFRNVTRSSTFSGSLDEGRIEEILESQIFGVFSCITEMGYPMTVPVHFVYWNHNIYIHIANNGEKYESLLKNKQVSFLVYEKRDPKDPLPYTMYDSVLIYGTGEFLNPADNSEAREALKQLALKCKMPGKAKGAYIDKYIGKFTVLKINIDHLGSRYLHVH